jgi:hypothetical protein
MQEVAKWKIKCEYLELKLKELENGQSESETPYKLPESDLELALRRVTMKLQSKNLELNEAM